MTRRYHGVLLDVDGTLVDSNDAHAHSWVETFEAHGHAVAFPRVRRMIGMGGDRLIETITGAPKGSKESERLSEARSENFRDKWLRHVKPLLGARALVLRLGAEGYQFAIASAAKATELDALLEIAGIVDLVDRRSTSSDVKASKPSPEAIEGALPLLDVDRSRVVMIGDTPYDVAAARGAGVDIVGVTTGGWSAEALAGAVAIFDGPAGLLARWADSPLS